MIQPFFRSIRFTVFLLYASILFLTVSFFSSSIYFYFRHEIYQKVDTLLEVKASGLESAIRTYLKTSKIEAPSGWAAFFAGLGQTAPRQKGSHFSTIADFLTESELNPPDRQIRMYVDIFDTSGHLIASSNKSIVSDSLETETLRAVLRGEKRISSFKITAGKRRPVRVHAITQPVSENGQVLYVIQVRMPMRPVERELEKILRVLIVSVLVTLLVASWAGFFLVNVTLRPVDQMVRKIRHVQSDNLSVRLDLPNANDEIRRLAQTFNEMLERLEKSFDAQRQIVQDLSHELKTPLTILRGQLEVTLKRARPVEEYEVLLRESLGEIEKIRKIIDDLLMLARLDSRAVALQIKEVDLSALLQSVMEDARTLAESKKITVTFEGPLNVMVRANELHLRRLFMNLLDNAVKYTHDGGRVSVRMAVHRDGVELSVQDNGVGISAHDLPHVFDRFFRAEKARRDGYGLGLSIVKSIVDAHKGRIWVESEPERGSTFRIFLPRYSPVTLL